MDKFNFEALLGLPFAALFFLNGLWEKSPFMSPYFRRLQETRLGKEGLRSRMLLIGTVVLIASALSFFRFW